MLNIQVTVNGKEKIIAELGKIGNRAKNLRPAFKVAGLLIIESTQRTFMASGRPERWAPLSTATLKRRGQGARILRDTGLLMTSVGKPSGNGIFTLKPFELRIGTNVPYAGVHQYGARHIPARPFMHLLPEDMEKIVKVFADHIAGGGAK